MKYIVEKEHEDYSSTIDNIEAAEGYTAEEYVKDCHANGVDWAGDEYDDVVFDLEDNDNNRYYKFTHKGAELYYFDMFAIDPVDFDIILKDENGNELSRADYAEVSGKDSVVKLVENDYALTNREIMHLDGGKDFLAR